MKKMLLSATALMCSVILFAQTKIADVAQFEKETIDFGKIKQGVPKDGTFIVKNIGKTPLIIEAANPTCGCTISDYTKEPIAPGKTGVINAKYNAAAMGHFEKHLTVKFAGVDEMKSITFTGEVMPAEQLDKEKIEEKVATPAPVAEPAASVVKPIPAKKITATKKGSKKMMKKKKA